jgi:inner membrane protein
LPENAIGNTGLSAPVQLSDAELARNIDFNFTLAIKGSGALHFMPLSGNSTYTLSSPWPSPSFEGNTLPSENHITEHGFFSKWVFNKANLPFTTVLQDTKQVNGDLVFGVSILQPVDDYAKTDRCIKYAILFIGLTFSLFFTLEIMQRKPVHPFQYALVGMALVIFYTLLLSISEYIHFDYAYLIASGATVVLISLYAKSHFKKWKIAGIFFTVLGGLYGFNYVLISLEDSALLIGSIGLFIVLATIMYASRKINWYDPSLVKAQAEVARS